jgi:GNAT superfamily N-acetyltransferase
MSLPDGLSLRTADLADVAPIGDMRVQVGWTAHDWALRLAIEPPNARCFVVEGPDGRLVAVGSGVAYPPLGLVGNMIVAEDHRRHGLGGMLLGSIIEFLEQAGCTRLELSATDQGRPLYEKHGFTPMEPGSHAELPRTLALRAPNGLRVATAGRTDADRLTAYDAARFGGSRAPLIQAMVSDSARPALMAARGDELVGYGWLRPEAGRIGPWVADDPEAAGAILADALRRASEREALTANIPISNRPGIEWLRSLGVAADPWEVRMARGPQVPRRDDTIYGSSVGALG